MAAVFILSIQVVFLLVSACFALPHLPLSGKSPRLPRSSSGCKLTLYDDSSQSLVKTTSDSDLIDDGWNDRASSVGVSGACQWILYEHGSYDGNSAVIGPGGRYTPSTCPSFLLSNNILSSVYCLPAEGTPAIVLFEHGCYRGPIQVHMSSNRYLGNFNDIVTSFIITGGTWQLYTDADYHGSSAERGPGHYPFPNSQTSFANDALSSVKLVGCSNLANPTNGQVSHTAGTTIGQTATYSCSTGYNLVGDSTRTCQATGMWSGSAPTCQVVNCGTLSNPTNGRVSHTAGTTYGQTATYSCNTGYRLFGSSTRTCQATGRWSGSAPTCPIVNCGTLTNPTNGQVSHTAGTTYGQRATYSCNTGYHLVGGSTRTCQATGMWSGSSPTCQAVSCGALANPANGQVGHTGATFGQTATYSCNTGYRLVGGSTRTCQATGVWSGSAPTCQAVDCGTLTSPVNGQVTHTAGTTFGQTATYSCNTGYNLVGDSSRTCQATGVWSGNASACQDINECIEGTDSCHDNATCHNTQGSYTCSCNTGYTGNGYSCTDINECLSNNGGCHHNCHNSDGSYTCSCNNGYELNSDGHTCEVPPLPPTNLQVSDVGNRIATLTWQAPVVTFLNLLTAVSSFQVMATQEQFVNVSDIYVDVDANTTTYTFPQTLEEYTVYTCTVKARNAFGLGNATQPVTLRTLQSVPSSPPQSVGGVAQSPTVLFFTWSPPPPVDINGILLYYEVDLREIETGQRWTFFALGDDLRLGSLHPYFTYQCEVAAHTVGRGSFSDPFQLKTLETAPSAPPSNLSVISFNSKTIALSWEPPPADQTNGYIRHYVITVTEHETALEFQEQSNYTHVTLQSLHPFYTYTCRVAAVTTGTGPYTGNFTIQLPEDVPTLGPQSVIMTAIDSTTLMISWMPPPLEHQNGIIREYQVNITERETGIAHHLTTAATTLTVSSLHPFYTYDCTLAAFTIAEGPYSVEVNITMPEDVPSSAPRMLRVTNVSSTSVVLTWEAPPPEDLNGYVIGYFINMTVLQTEERLEVFSNSTMPTVYNLQPYTVYTCVSATVTNAGRGPFSDAIQIQTLEAAPTSPPQNLTATPINSRSVYLSWSLPPREHHNGVIQQFWSNITEVDTGRRIQMTSLGTSLTVSSLHPFYIYWFSVAAYTVDLGPFTEPLMLQMPQDVPSSPPSNYTAVALSSRSILLTWDAPPVEGQNGIITGYIVNITKLETGEVSTMFTESHNLTLYSLQPFTMYGFLVSAQTVAGSGPATLFVSVTTHEEAPIGQPVNVTVLFVGPTSIHISWDHPPEDTHYGMIREYQITYTELETGAVFNISTDSETTQLTVNSLHPYYTYTFFVVPVTVDVGTNHTQITIRTEETAPSQPPSNVQVPTINPQQLELVWAPPPMDQQNGIIRRYIVNVTSADGGEELITYSQTTSTLVQNLQSFTTYFCSVSAETVAPGPFSPPVVVQTAEDEPSDTPQAVRHTAVTSTSVDLSWYPPPTEHHNGIIRYYTVRVVVQNTGVIFARSTAELSITIAGLHPYYTYNFSISAMTVVPGPYSVPLTVQTLPDVPVGSPEITAAIAVDPMTVQLSWIPPRLDEQNGIIIYYIVNVTATQPRMEVFQQNCTLVPCNITHLYPYQTYQFTVSAVTVGPGPYGEAYTVTTLEAAAGTPPQNFTVEVLAPTTVFLRWSPPTPDQQNGVIRNYHIRQYETSTGILTNYMQGGNYTELVIGSLRAGNQYQFTIAADTVKLGPFSGQVTVTTLESAPSDAPSNLTVIAINSTSVYFSWLPPDEDQHNGDIRHYNIRILDLLSGREVQLNSTNTMSIHSDLHPAYTYRFTVAAVTVEIGPYSDPAITTMPEDVPTVSPQNVESMTVNSTTILMTWEPPPPEHQNGIIIAYVVNVSVEDNDIIPQQYSTSALSVALVGLHPYSLYMVAVAAQTGVGRGPFSNSITIRPPEDAPSAPPQYLRQDAVTATSVTLSWQPPPEEDRNGLIRLYYVFVTELESGRSFTLNSTTTNYRVHNLHPFYTYNFSVAAVTVAAGPINDNITVQTLEAVPSGPPRNLATVNVTSHSISLTWDPPTSTNQNGIIRTYIVSMTVLETEENIQLMSNTTQINLELLHPYYTYSFGISAVTIGAGPPSSVYNVTTDEQVPGGPPENFTVDVISSTQILLMWQPPASEIQNGRVRLYTISVFEVQTGTSYSYTLHSQPSEDPALQVESLHPHYEYVCSVAAVTIGPGPPTSPLTVRTFEDAPSGPPQSISAVALDPIRIQINWSQPLPEEQNGIIQSYIVNITTAETGQHIQLTTNNTTITAEGLHPYYNYHISVAAVTIAAGPYTVIQVVQTPQDVPSGTPTNVQGFAISSTSIRLTWEPPQPGDQNGVIQVYNIIITEVVTGRMMYFREGGMDSILIVNSLHPYYTYQCSISAETIGPGPGANINVTTHQGVPNNTPQNITISLLNATSAEVHWDPPPFEDQNGVIELYRLFFVEVNTGRVIEPFHAESASIMLQELRPFHVYQFVIAASTVAGLGPFSTPSFFRMPESAPGAPVHNFTVENVYATQVELSWLPPDPQLWNGRITNYTIVYELLRPVGMMSANSSQPIMMKAIPTQGNPLANNADPRRASVPLQREMVVVDDLQEDHVYKFSVFMTNAAGRSGISMTIIQALLGAEPSGTPNAIQISILSSTSIEFQWLPPDFVDQNGVITGYTIILTNIESGFSQNYNTSGNVTVQIIDGLQKFTRYYARIAASTVHGRGPLSNATVFQTYEDTPGPVRNVAVELRQGADNVTAVLSWLPPDEPNGIITQYQVFYAGYNGTQPLDGPYSISNLQNLQFETPEMVYGLTYQFKVRASTRVGYGNYSGSVSIIVPNLTITPPTTSTSTTAPLTTTPPTAAPFTTSTPTTAPPSTVAGNTTDVQQVVDSSGTQIGIISTAVVGWLIVLGMILLVIVLFYRHKKRKRKYQVERTELHASSNIYGATSTPGGVYEEMDNFRASNGAMDEPSTGATLKMAEADEGTPNITMSDPDTAD